jgi:NTP pyrophosphatase (non-canonical NTP hydrolase)
MKKHQKAVDKWFKDNKWKYWSPLSILARLYEECGEFARLVNHLYGDKQKKRRKTSGVRGGNGRHNIYAYLFC